MKLEMAARVDQGRRPYNDDRAMLIDQILESGVARARGGTPVAAVVCDGCGGYRGGGYAAETVLGALKDALPALLSGVEQTMQGVFASAEEAIDQGKRAYPPYADMCTTIVGCVFLEEGTRIFHAGDSRCYRYDGYSLARMTVDHSLVQEMVDMGRLTEEEAAVSPRRNVITRCMGIHALAPDIYVSSAPIWEGETYLLCSDGFWESVTPAQIKEMLARDIPLAEKAEELVELALSQGSDDNVTVCLVTRIPEDSADTEA
ncbi:MAG: serine/threonine-protein phosphatase [Oscillospiraceae bacterium]|nr:serine/threonine-protein phosphatase [Oscillospiraceae bacterium]